MELGHALIKVTQHGIVLAEGDGRDAGIEGGDERLVVDVEAMENVRDEFVILDGLPAAASSSARPRREAK